MSPERAPQDSPATTSHLGTATLPFVCVCFFNSKDTCILPRLCTALPTFGVLFDLLPAHLPRQHLTDILFCTVATHPWLPSYRHCHLPQNTYIFMHPFCTLLLESVTCSPTLMLLFPESRKLLKRCLSSNGEQCSSRGGQEKALFKTMGKLHFFKKKKMYIYFKSQLSQWSFLQGLCLPHWHLCEPGHSCPSQSSSVSC